MRCSLLTELILLRKFHDVFLGNTLELKKILRVIYFVFFFAAKSNFKTVKELTYDLVLYIHIHLLA